MALEIERKWLVKEVPSKPQVFYVVDAIAQAYVIDKDHTVLRVRSVTRFQYDSMYNSFGVITVKGPSYFEGAVEEYEMDIPYSMAEVLISACDKVLYKSRTNIPFANDRVIELDVFDGKLAGLIVAEVEFPNIEEANAFVPPDWFGQEVTGRKEYANANLINADAPPKEN
jgi:CYTH domain-containing protein